MTPLQAIAMGLVIVFLQSGSAHDIFANPIGWLLVLFGATRLPGAHRRLLVGWVVVALLASVPLWFAALREPLYAEDPALAWAADLPEFIALVVLCFTISELARPTDRRGHLRFGTLTTLFALLAAAPLVAIALDSSGTADGISLALIVCDAWLVWSLFSHHAKSYVAAREAD